jgi:hypothetical protein
MPFTQPMLFNQDDGLSLEMKPSAPSQVRVMPPSPLTATAALAHPDSENRMGD